MESQIIITVAVIFGIIGVLLMEVFPSSIVLAGGLLVLLVTGVVSPGEALSGLSNQGMITVALLFIVAAGVLNTGALTPTVHYLLKRRKRKGPRTVLIKMMVPVSALSAFLNNTPIVAIFTPIVKKWTERYDFSPSKFLIPLSYAAIFGGMCTLIGTSTNLVVHGMMLETGDRGLSMFELAKIGVPCTILGWVYLVLLGQKLLPERKDILERVRDDAKQYSISMRVTKASSIVGQTVQDAGLRNLKNIYLIEIEREGIRFGPVSHNEKVQEGDILYFVGITKGIADLDDIPGLVPAAHEMFEKDFSPDSSHLVEAVVSESSPILGKTVKESNFREKYQAGVVAIHRGGEKIEAKVGDVRLKSGDVLLLYARSTFLKNWKYSRDFYLVSTISKRDPKAYHKAPLASAIMAFMVILATLGSILDGGKISMFYAASIAAALMIITRCISINGAKDALDMNVLVTIACALGISRAMYSSGTAEVIASFMVSFSKDFGPIAVLAAIYLLTNIFAEIITHAAAAAIVFPIALAASLQLGASPRPFFIAIAIAASASFSTPIGYQTNLIVQGAGGYKFRDYLKVGLPLNILFLVLSVLIIPLFWKF